MTRVHIASLDKIDIEAGVSGNHSLSTSEMTFGSPTSLSETQDDDDMCKNALSSYIDSQSSSEQEETNGDSYPESTINLQDLQ